MGAALFAFGAGLLDLFLSVLGGVGGDEKKAGCGEWGSWGGCCGAEEPGDGGADAVQGAGAGG